MIATLLVLVSVIGFIAVPYVISSRREAAAARRRRLSYVHAVGRTGRQHGMDELLWSETCEKTRSIWSK